MARCSCASSCGCLIAAGPGTTVNGSGSAASPYVISARLSTDADNCARFGGDGGLYVSCSGGGGGGGGATVEGLPPTGVIAGHRGVAGLSPENTTGSMELARAHGVNIVEFDVRTTSDGALIVMHDETIDRTTDGTGGTSNYSAQLYREAITVDGSNDDWFGTCTNINNRCAGLNRPVPFLDDVFTAVGRSVVLSPEIKTPDVGPPLLSAIQRAGLTPSVIVQSIERTDLPPFVAAGIACSLVIGDEAAATANPAAGLLAEGIQWAYCSLELSDATISSYVAAGVSVLVYVVNRHVQRQRVELVGVRGIISDQPVYAASGALRPYKRTSDPFGEAVPAHGWMGPPSDGGNWSAGGSSGRPAWNPPPAGNPAEQSNYWLLPAALGTPASAYNLLLGFFCPVDAADATYTVEAGIRWQQVPTADMSRWLGFTVCCADDHAFIDGDTVSQPEDQAYVIAFRASGDLNIFKRVGSVGTVLGTGRWLPAGQTAAAATTYPVRWQVTPTQIAAVGAGAGAPAQVVTTDTDFRGPYLHLAKHQANTPFNAMVGEISLSVPGALAPETTPTPAPEESPADAL